jgi:hypothetical protein
MVAQIPVQDTDEQEKQIITIDVSSSLSFLLTVPCKLSAKPASPAYMPKQEQTAVNRTAIEIFSPFGFLELNSF